MNPLAYPPVVEPNTSAQKYPYAEGRSPEGPRPDRQPPQRVSLPSRTRIAVDKASIYRIEAGSGCVRQYSYRTKPYETLKVGTLGLPAPCAASPSTPRSIPTGTLCWREQGHGRAPERTPARVSIPARGHQPQLPLRPKRNYQYRGIREISCSWEARYRGASKELVRPGCVPHLRTTRTGQWACRTTLSETLPIRARLKPPSPRLPMTISPAPNSSLSLTIAWSFGPCICRCAPATVPPASSTFLICSSSTPWAS